MSADYKCQCGATERSGMHPYECERCTTCGSKIIASGEQCDAPLEHVPIAANIEGVVQVICKRCRQVLNG